MQENANDYHTTVCRAGRLKRLGRFPFYIFCTMLWLLPVGCILEMHVRRQSTPNIAAPESIPFTMSDARRLFGSIYERYCTGWPFPEPEIPELGDIREGDHGKRQEIATARGEWIVVVNRQGTVLHSYGEPLLENNPRTIGDIAAFCFVTESYPHSLEGAFHQLFAGEYVAPLTVPVHVGAVNDLYSVQFLPYRENDDVIEAVLSFAPSLYCYGMKRFKPNVELKTFNTTVMMEQFSTNRHGFRGPEIRVPKPRGVVRVACMGGSTTVWGLTNELTYPAMLEKMLRNYFPDQATRIEVVNCGIFGLNSPEEVDMMEEIMALDPDILVYYNFINDLALRFAPWLHSDETWPTWPERVKLLCRKSRFLDRYANEWLLPSRTHLIRFLQECTLDNIETIIQTATGHSVEVACCSFAGVEPDAMEELPCDYAEHINIRTLFPDLSLSSYTIMRRCFNEALHELCRKQGAVYVPVAENIQAGYDVFMDECHFNPMGTEMQARIVFEHIKDGVASRF